MFQSIGKFIGTYGWGLAVVLLLLAVSIFRQDIYAYVKQAKKDEVVVQEVQQKNSEIEAQKKQETLNAEQAGKKVEEGRSKAAAAVSEGEARSKRIDSIAASQDDDAFLKELNSGWSEFKVNSLNLLLSAPEVNSESVPSQEQTK